MKINEASKMKLLGCKRIFFVYFEFKHGCENEFQDNNKKLCYSLKIGSPKIDLRADGTNNLKI